MFRRCLSDLLLYAIMFIFLSKCFCLDSGTFHNCSQDSCSNSLSNRPCPIRLSDSSCDCAYSNSSVCDTLDQQSFVNLTGAQNENASEWTCCFCSSQASYCCNKCNTTVSSLLHEPTTFFRLLLVYVLECDTFLNEQDKLSTSLGEGIANLTGIPFGSISVVNISCNTGQRPYCGVDVAHITAHHRAKRLTAGGRGRGGSSSKNQKENTGTYYNYNTYRETLDLTCESFYANITVHGNERLLQNSLDLLRGLQTNDTLKIPLWNGKYIYSSFMLSAMNDASYQLHTAPKPTPGPRPPSEAMPAIALDLKPMMYAGGAIFGLIITCVLWKFIKHSWLLKRKKFTNINSDRVDPKAAQRLREVTEAMEENNHAPHANGSAFTTSLSVLPRSDGGPPTKNSNWSSPGYLPSMLAPAYKPTELHNQRSPPRLILDEGSDIEERLSFDSASEANMEEEETLSDILNSDDENVMSGSLKTSFSQGLRNPAFHADKELSLTAAYMEEEMMNGDVPQGHSTGTGRKPKPPKNTAYTRDSRQNSKEAFLPSDSDEDDTVFLSPVKKDKKKKKRDKRTKEKKSSDKDVRKKSLTPPGNDENPRRNSLMSSDGEKKSRKKSLSPEYGGKTGGGLMLTPTGTEKKPRRNSVTPEPKRRKSSTPEDTKIEGKKKKQKGDGEKRGKLEDLERLDEGSVKATEESNAHLRANSTPETKRRRSTVPEVVTTEGKQKKQKRRKAENPEQIDEGDSEERVVQLKVNSLTTDRTSINREDSEPKKKQKGEPGTRRASDQSLMTVGQWKASSGAQDTRRRKSMIPEDTSIESKKVKKKQKGEVEDRKSGDTESWEDGMRRGSNHNIAQLKGNRISPIPTGYKSPSLVIKPSYDF